MGTCILKSYTSNQLHVDVSSLWQVTIPCVTFSSDVHAKGQEGYQHFAQGAPGSERWRDCTEHHSIREHSLGLFPREVRVSWGFLLVGRPFRQVRSQPQTNSVPVEQLHTPVSSRYPEYELPPRGRDRASRAKRRGEPCPEKIIPWLRPGTHGNSSGPPECLTGEAAGRPRKLSREEEGDWRHQSGIDASLPNQMMRTEELFTAPSAHSRWWHDCLQVISFLLPYYEADSV